MTNRNLSSKLAWPTLAVFIILVVSLKAMGRVWWCQCGQLHPWTSDVVSSHNSQHLLDPYSFSHFQHGLASYLILWLLLGGRWSIGTRAAIALLIEALWEIAENTPFTIERYREATISLDYYGDSVWNSIGDMLSCAAGFAVAALIPTWTSAAIYLSIELGMLLLIRDSLVLNILMLIHPVETIKQWQSGG